ncbi:MAG: SDR family oxidoreductase [Patescibacteria group bacterium]
MAKTVLVTGSSGGIGKATVEAFAQAGWQVAATSRSGDPNVFSKWPNVKVYKLDVTNKKSIESSFTAVMRDFKAIDVVANNAGYALDGVFEATSEQQIRQQFDTNVFGLMSVTREAIKVMRPAKHGTIIQVASMGGRLTFPLYSAYHASKWAVEGFSESLQYELEQFGIRIKIIEPGVIKTEFYGKSGTNVKPPQSLGYNAFISQVESTSKSSGATGEAPELVAKTILKAANDNSTKLRYVVGSPAPLLLSLRKLLPERAFFWLMRKGYRIR